VLRGFRTAPGCDARWLPAEEKRWEADWADDGPEEKLLFYCPRCAEREFGSNPIA
jgi:hypothetical protein